MTERESDALVVYLHAARLDWTERVTPLLLRVWADVLCVFPAAVAQHAMPTFHARRAPGRQGFPPELSEVVVHLDAAWQAQVQRHTAEDRLDERSARRGLLDAPKPSGQFAADCLAAIAALTAGVGRGETVDPEPILRKLGEQWPADFPAEAIERQRDGLLGGRIERERMIARYHAHGEARLESCGRFCEHGRGERIQERGEGERTAH